LEAGHRAVLLKDTCRGFDVSRRDDDDGKKYISDCALLFAMLGPGLVKDNIMLSLGIGVRRLESVSTKLGIEYGSSSHLIPIELFSLGFASEEKFGKMHLPAGPT
jgi:hypothetical protein